MMEILRLIEQQQKKNPQKNSLIPVGAIKVWEPGKNYLSDSKRVTQDGTNTNRTADMAGGYEEFQFSCRIAGTF